MNIVRSDRSISNGARPLALPALREAGRALRLASWIGLVQLVELGHAERLFKVVERALRLRSLFVEQVVQNVFVTLDQPLRILLPVLQLLVAIALDSFQQSGQR
jgi:hypothetical protein